ncbi:hypothetical protein PSHT_09823 [Puccinia striiformis]|uniref:DNA 3'-5' helicase n=1 Tax=Puccinia striiformis TaxID=27350 RepID=A0A2S4VDX4_9BASI|nr:hypothetical protein PSHT_09823 [Puccinia striiformis]
MTKDSDNTMHGQQDFIGPLVSTDSGQALKLPHRVTGLSNELLDQHIRTQAIDFYHDQPKDLQVKAVSTLVRGRKCFLRAGTGYGKTRISEMYFNLFKTKVVVLVLNPLDSLGDDQVREKKIVKIKAINLNKMMLNRDVIQKIKRGYFGFVYLSPKVFLNNTLFTEMLFSHEFQKILALMVVDEAHMIYLWGLVTSRASKGMAAFSRHEDWGPLRLQPSDVTMLDGELTRPEIRIIRIPMDFMLKSCDDLLRIFAPHSKVPADEAVPMIIYSSTRNLTFQVMKVVNEARHTKKHEYDPLDGFIRRYHSVTGKDKEENMEDYTAGKFPVMSATMALGLGQNLKRVRCVIHMGRGDPASIVQMIGRCGRDGNPGLALLFMERIRKKGKNRVADFDPGENQDEDDRMDAMAVTPMCLRVAVNMDNRHGYIPLEADDRNYVAERAREEKVGFESCKCSTCYPGEAKQLLNVIQQMTTINFKPMLENPTAISNTPSIVTLTRKKNTAKAPSTCNLSATQAVHLVTHLVDSFNQYFTELMCHSDKFIPEEFFSVADAQQLVASLDQVCPGDETDGQHLDKVMGGPFFPGQVAMLTRSISDWMASDYYQSILNERAIAAAEEVRRKAEFEEEAYQILEEAAAQTAKKNFITREKKRVNEEKKWVVWPKAKAHAAEEEMDRLADQRKLDKLLEFPRQETMKNKERSARILAVDQARMKEAARHAAEKLGRKEAIKNNKMRAEGKKLVRERRARQKMGQNIGDHQPSGANPIGLGPSDGPSQE